MNFEDFRGDAEIGWGKYSTVYSSRSRDSLELAVKAVRLKAPDEGFVDGVEPEDFKLSITRQKEAHEKSCDRIAPIRAVAVQGLVGHYVTDRYERSLHDLITRKVSVTPSMLRRIATGCLDILEGLRVHGAGAHGNLKPSNILCNGQGDQLEIVLTDLAAHPKSFGDDIRGLANAIYQLVSHREVLQLDWPIQSSPEWKRLGLEADVWREYCNTLLNPSLGHSEESLLVARNAIPKPVGKKRRSLAVTVLIVGVLGAASVPAIKWFDEKYGPRPEITEAQWTSLCEDHEKWLDLFLTNKEWPKRWAKEPELVSLAEELNKLANNKPFNEAFNPKLIWERERSSDPKLQSKDFRQFTPAELKGLSKAGAKQAEHAKMAADLVRDRIQKWKGFAELKTGIDFLGQEKLFELWSKPPWAPPWDEKGLWALKTDDLALVMTENLEFVEIWRSFQEQIKRLQNTEDPFLKAAPEETRRSLAGTFENFPALTSALKSTAGAVAEVADFYTANKADFDPEDFPKVAPLYAGKALTPAVAADWKRDAAETIGKPEEWLKSVSAQFVGNASPAIQSKWKSTRDALLAGVTAATLKADRPRFSALKKRLRNVSEVLLEFDKALPVPNLDAHSANTKNDSLAKGLQAAALENREATITGILKLIPSSDTDTHPRLWSLPGAREKQTSYLSSLEYFSRVATLLEELASHFARASSLDEGIDATAGAIQNGATGNAAMQTVFALPEVKRLLESVAELRSVSSADNASLQQKLNSPTLSVALAALGKLHQTTKARSAEEWEKFRTWTLPISLNLQSKIKSEERITELRNRISDYTNQQWLMAFRSYDSEQMPRLLELKQSAQLPDSILSGRDRFNILLLETRAALLTGQLTDPQDFRDQFVKKALSTPEMTPPDQQTVSQLLSELKKIAFTSDKKAASKERGPGQRGWVSDNARAETLRWNGHTVSMVRIQRANGSAFYLADASVSIGLVASWMERPDSGNIRLIPPAPNRIPAVWQAAGRSIAPSPDWFGSFNTAQFPKESHYPPDFEAKAPPQKDTPMVYISAETADLIAQSMGFRLPTVDEWLDAYNQSRAKESPAATFNLRDATWSAEHNYLKNYAATHSLDGRPAQVAWLDSAIFRPDPGTLLTASRQNAQAEHGGRDGVLWLAPVRQGGAVGGIYHLVGNVAQYVKSKDGGSFAIIGGSALCEPGPHDKAYPVSKTGLGYADVGFRLALDADFIESPQVTQMKDLIRKTAFLTQ